MPNGKYRFKTSELVKNILRPLLSARDILELVENYPIQCPHLIIMCRNSSFTMSVYKHVLNEYKKNKHFEYHVVNGTHDVHLERPELVTFCVNTKVNYNIFVENEL